jgi:hypothetical protein
MVKSYILFITAPLMPEDIPGIRCKGLKNRRILVVNLKKIRNNE